MPTNRGRIDPILYGLPKRTVLEEHVDGLALVVDRKTRIIMADGRRILEKVELLKGHGYSGPIVLKTPAPVCSKTQRFLAEHGIAVLPLD